METSHPKPAPSAVDVERTLSGIQYPKTKEEIVTYASQRITPSEKELFSLIQSLPSRSYRDSAEVAIAIGELKGRQVRTAEEAARAEQPSVKGGAAAAESVSAAAIAKALSGVDFPKRKEELRRYAQRHAPETGIKEPESVLNVIGRLPDKEYQNMADVEKSVGQVL
jgi:hypothetical protein